MTCNHKTDIEVAALLGVIDSIMDDLRHAKQIKHRRVLTKLQDEGIVRIHLESPTSVYREIK